MMRRYRIGRDWLDHHKWAVQVWRIWWPFWTEEAGDLNSKEEAADLIQSLKTHF